MKPGSEEWKRRVANLTAKENHCRKRWFYISYADGPFLGAVIIEGRGPITANARAHSLGINPGGEALIMEIPEACAPPPPDMVDRLLTRKELEAFDRRMGCEPSTQEEVDAFVDRYAKDGNRG